MISWDDQSRSGASHRTVRGLQALLAREQGWETSKKCGWLQCRARIQPPQGLVCLSFTHAGPFSRAHWRAWQDHVQSPTCTGEPPGSGQWGPGHWLLSGQGVPQVPRPEAGLCLPQMHLLEGSVGVHRSLAYVPQQAWIFSGSVRENILLGRQYDKAR